MPLLQHTDAGRLIGKQVVRSGTSIGANVEEAQSGSSKDDFIYKMNIALRESRETHYWLRLAKESKLITSDRVDVLIKEADELRNSGSNRQQFSK
jgi:four helix bundle protein